MLAMLIRAAMSSVATPGPVNSTAAFSTSPSCRAAQREDHVLAADAGRSRPVQHDLHGARDLPPELPVAQIAAASVRTTGVPSAPSAPYMLACESDATTSAPGHA
jgi:hypothetical protein